MKLLLALVVVMSTGLIAALGSVAAVGNECAGLQTCIDVPGPWVSVPESGEVLFLLDCPQRQGVIAGVDAKATSRAVHVTFDGLLGSPVAPGRTTSAVALFRAVSGHHTLELAKPLMGCVPPSTGGLQTTAYHAITPTGGAIDLAATEVLIAPGSVHKATLGCANHESLVYSWSTTAFATEQPPVPELALAVTVKRVVRNGQVAVTTSASEALPKAAKALVQIGVACSK